MGPNLGVGIRELGPCPGLLCLPEQRLCSWVHTSCSSFHWPLRHGQPLWTTPPPGAHVAAYVDESGIREGFSTHSSYSLTSCVVLLVHNSKPQIPRHTMGITGIRMSGWVGLDFLRIE